MLQHGCPCGNASRRGRGERTVGKRPGWTDKRHPGRRFGCARQPCVRLILAGLPGMTELTMRLLRLLILSIALAAASPVSRHVRGHRSDRRQHPNQGPGVARPARFQGRLELHGSQDRACGERLGHPAGADAQEHLRGSGELNQAQAIAGHEGVACYLCGCYRFRFSRGTSSVGRASASQAEGRGFEPRVPLRNH